MSMSKLTLCSMPGLIFCGGVNVKQASGAKDNSIEDFLNWKLVFDELSQPLNIDTFGF